MDSAFQASAEGLNRALELLLDRPENAPADLPGALPAQGFGEAAVLEALAPLVLGQARRLDDPLALAHMDPPTPWIAWATTLWNAALNQNLLHPDVSPAAGRIERQVVDWLSPYFGMDGGHMTPGSTVANLTALWAGRETAGVRRVIASEAAHLSIPKAAHLLGLDFEPVPVGPDGTMDASAIPGRLSDAALVLTAGTTSSGAIDDLSLAGRAAWTHVDAAWAGPLALSERHRLMLTGVENADSIAVSAHKWLFQPKESGLILFQDTQTSHAATSFGGDYLLRPNVGVLGSHGATAVPLLATLLAWGEEGVAERIDRCMEIAEKLHSCMSADPRFTLFGPNRSGVLLWRPVGDHSLDEFAGRLPAGTSSRTRAGGVDWFRQVAANPNADVDLIWQAINAAF